MTPPLKQRGKAQRKKDFESQVQESTSQPVPSTSTGFRGLPKPVFLTQALESTDEEEEELPVQPRTATPWGDKMLRIKRAAKARKHNYKY